MESSTKEEGCETGMMAQTCNPCTWELVAGGAGVQGHPQPGPTSESATQNYIPWQSPKDDHAYLSE